MSTPPLYPSNDPQQLGHLAPTRPLSNGMAIAALVCGILGLGCLPVGIVGLVLGIIATIRATKEPTRYGGRGMAIAGICTGALGSMIIVPAVLISILLPSLSRARELAKRALDASNLRGIGQSMIVYAADNRNAFPPDLQTLIVDGSCTPKQFIDPSSGHQPPACDYFYVAGLTGKDPANWIIAYCAPNYHSGEGANVLYMNGTVQFVKDRPPGTFKLEIDKFKAAYEKKRGEPPKISAPQ